MHTWLPFAPNKPAYKILPHFQIRFFTNHLFIIFPIIHQRTNKQEKLKIFHKHFHKLTSLPTHYTLSLHHIKTQNHYINHISNQHLHPPIHTLKNLKKPQFFL
ncbi:DUF1054 family protein, partial [Staphylococcus epidermidis]|uniref:DUF1054 family protein n=1 Tax=Staphylococcus epidermidis TaxID=1282 RepID=UPI0021B24310